MTFRKIICGFLCLLLGTFPVFAVEGTDTAEIPQEPVATPADWTMQNAAVSPLLYGAHAALLCADNGQLLLGKDMDTPAAPASITKVMTALVVLESGIDLSQQVTVSSNAVNSIEWDSTHIGLQAGEIVTLDQMMAAMLIQSANDAANVLAEAVGGSLENFAEMMNTKAAELGCKHTHFMNAHGLDNPEHYTTAYDMALIGQAVLQYPDFTRFAGALEYTMPPTNMCAETRVFYTKQNVLCHNPEQYYYEGAFAGKNGWTTNARQTLITFAKRNDITLIAVTMTSNSKYNKVLDTIAMFDYGFQQFTPHTISAQEQEEAASAFSNCDTDALQDMMVLLPNSAAEDALQVTPQKEEDALAVTYYGNTLAEIHLTENAVSANTKTESSAGGSTPEKRHVSAKQIALYGAAGAAGVFALFAIHRNMRIRKQRKQLRMRRQREQQRFQNEK